MSTLPEQALLCEQDLLITAKLIGKLRKPHTNANWDNEARLLARQLERVEKSASSLRKALAPPKPA